MTVEVANSFAELDVFLPDDTGTPGEGLLSEDIAHTRLIKKVLKLMFPGAGGTGFNRQILAIEDELNACTGLVSDLQAQLTAAAKTSVPVGAMIMYTGTFASIPGNYALCNGVGGTPDMSSDFIYGTNTEGQVGLTGGSDDSITPAHTHNADHNHTGNSTSSDGSHQHNIPYVFGTGYDGTVFMKRYTVKTNTLTTSQTQSKGAHTHPISIANSLVTSSPVGESGVGKNQPPYLTLAYIQRMS